MTHVPKCGWRVATKIFIKHHHFSLIVFGLKS
jgi:hypothetical protein